MFLLLCKALWDTINFNQIIEASINNKIRPHTMQSNVRRLKIHLSHIYPQLSSSTTKHHNQQDKFNMLTHGNIPTFSIQEMTEILHGNILSSNDLKNIIDRFLSAFENEDHKQLVLSKLNTGTQEREKQLYINAICKRILENYMSREMRKDDVTFLIQMYLSYAVHYSVGMKIRSAVLFSSSILQLGTERHEYLLTHVESMKFTGCLLLSELTQSNLRTLETTAVYNPDSQQFVINTPNKGAFKVITGTTHIPETTAIVFARLITRNVDHGVHSFIVPLRNKETHTLLPGITINNYIDYTTAHFHHICIPRENLLNRYSDVEPDGTYVSSFSSDSRFSAFKQQIIKHRLSVCVGSLIIRKISTLIAVRYSYYTMSLTDLNEKLPLLQLSSYYTRLMPIVASCYAYNIAIQQLFTKLKRLTPHDSSNGSLFEDDLLYIHTLSSALKAVLCWDTQEHLQTMRQCCDREGYLMVNRIGELIINHDTLQSIEGDNTTLAQQLSIYLLKKFSKQFTGNIVSDGYKFLRKQMGVIIANRNPVTVRLKSSKHLRNSTFHVKAFEYRTASLLYTIFKSGKGSMDVPVSEYSPAMLRLSRAFVEQFVLEQFVNLLEQTPNKQSPVYTALKLTCDVFALKTLETNILDFVPIVKSSKYEAISQLNNQLCKHMASHATTLVDSFGFPDGLLNAPVGIGIGNLMEHIHQ
jgi:acyl-CoA oxidase